jgi:hypothetical protein
LEVVLIDASAGTLQTLGTAMAELGRNTQTLTYSIPTVTSLRNFDEIKIVFHRNGLRIDRSSKIAIERFVLAP